MMPASTPPKPKARVPSAAPALAAPQATAAELFTPQTRAILYGMQETVAQRMLDFDFLSRRETPSVACLVNPSTTQGFVKVFWGRNEILVPVYATLREAANRHPDASVLVNFASLRSAYDVTREALEINSLKAIAIIAEGVPERRTRELIALAKRKGKLLIGPATVGGLAAGAFRIGNTGGSAENLIAAKLYRPGHVGLVTKSGGLSNELFNAVARNADGAREGVAIGGDAYPGSTLLDHALRYQANPNIALIVVLGEVGAGDEYALADAIRAKKITKPVVALVTGTCASVFPGEVQFGHAGAKSGSARESAEAKNKALADAGAVVPKDFAGLEDAIRTEFQKLVKEGKVQPAPDVQPPELPVDFTLVKDNVRVPTHVVSTVSDERGEDVLYAGVPLGKLMERNASLGEVVGLLWFKKKLPRVAADYLERVLIVTADHGPAVSGAHNTIVTARAGKDVVSALCSGLLTIGPRFGGAIDDAAKYFKRAVDYNIPPEKFVDDMKRQGTPIPGIGHRIKSIYNPDKRVGLLKDYAHKHFKNGKYLAYALEVEKLTTQKKPNLILNVDGALAVTFLDMMASTGAFTSEEIQETIDIGFFNALFALGRSIGFIAHALDQKRLKQPLYRHEWNDILFQVPEQKEG